MVNEEDTPENGSFAISANSFIRIREAAAACHRSYRKAGGAGSLLRSARVGA